MPSLLTLLAAVAGGGGFAGGFDTGGHPPEGGFPLLWVEAPISLNPKISHPPWGRGCHQRLDHVWLAVATSSQLTSWIVASRGRPRLAICVV